MSGTPNAKAGGAEQSSQVLVGHHDSRICLLHSTHLVVQFWEGGVGGSVCPARCKKTAVCGHRCKTTAVCGHLQDLPSI